MFASLERSCAVSFSELNRTDAMYCFQQIEDFAKDKGKEMVAFCRCWKSSTMPYCDGSHAKHNTECGDNVGPLLVPVPAVEKKRSVSPDNKKKK